MKCFVEIVRLNEIKQCIDAITKVGKILAITQSEYAGALKPWIFTAGYVVVYEAEEEAEWLRKT